nr:high mobility group nucleosome-binding domain-containing protein 5-like [Aedes albopictus]
MSELSDQCDSCDDWHHFVCVGVTQEVEQNSWNCCKCLTAAANQKKTSSKVKSLKTKKAKKISTKAKEKKSYKPAARRSMDKKKADNTTTDKTTGVDQRRQAGEQDVGAIQTSRKLEVVSISMKETTVNGRKAAKSVKTTSSRRSERMVLEVQLKKLEAEETLMEEEMTVVGNQQDPAEKVSSWLKDQKTDESSRSSSAGSSAEISSEESSSDEETSEAASSTESSEDEIEDSAERFKPNKQSTPKSSKRTKPTSEQYYIEPAARYGPELERHGVHTVIYKLSDVKIRQDHHSHEDGEDDGSAAGSSSHHHSHSSSRKRNHSISSDSDGSTTETTSSDDRRGEESESRSKPTKRLLRIN